MRCESHLFVSLFSARGTGIWWIRAVVSVSWHCLIRQSPKELSLFVPMSISCLSGIQSCVAGHGSHECREPPVCWSIVGCQPCAVLGYHGDCAGPRLIPSECRRHVGGVPRSSMKGRKHNMLMGKETQEPNPESPKSNRTTTPKNTNQATTSSPSKLVVFPLY